MFNKKIRCFLGFVKVFVGIFAVTYTLSQLFGIFSMNHKIAALELQKKELQEVEIDTKKQSQLLEDEEYVTRYARENYVFSKDGEHVTLIPQ